MAKKGVPPSPRSMVLAEGMPITVGWTVALASILESLRVEGDGGEIAVDGNKVRKTTPEIRIGKGRTTSTITACDTGSPQDWGSGTMDLYDPTLSGSAPNWTLSEREVTLYNAFFPETVDAALDVAWISGLFGDYRVLILVLECP